jgi:hypothetical protein
MKGEMMKFPIKIILLLLIFSILSACTKSREQTFDSTLRAYEQVIRWRNIEKVNQFRKKPLVFSNIAKERFKNIKVTDYETTNIEDKSPVLKIVTVTMKYYHDQYARERSIEDKQEWHFDETSELWYISSPLPNF